jgi:CsoR family transcriptional regulator, copper-sensing transcriptional repressor
MILIMRKCMDVPKIQARIKKIEGQLRAISEMVDKDIPCEDILIQINASKSAMHKVGQLVLEGHLQHCVRDGIAHGDADRTIAEFAKAVEHFSRMG